MKKTIAILSMVFVGTPAVAGPYVNVEANQGYAGRDYTGAVVETHVGYENSLGEHASWYIQGGPHVSFPDNANTVGATSGKVGGSVNLTKRASVYGELSAATVEDIELDGLNVGVKSGFKYSF
jgi:hypothetical protein